MKQKSSLPKMVMIITIIALVLVDCLYWFGYPGSSNIPPKAMIMLGVFYLGAGSAAAWAINVTEKEIEKEKSR